MKLSRKQTNSCTNRSNCEKISKNKQKNFFHLGKRNLWLATVTKWHGEDDIVLLFGRRANFTFRSLCIRFIVIYKGKRLSTLRNCRFNKKSKPSAGRFRPLGGGVTAGSSWLLPVSLLLTFCSNWISFRLYSLSKLPCSAIFLPYSTS